MNLLSHFIKSGKNLPAEKPAIATPETLCGFAALDLHPALLDAVAGLGYREPTPIQTKAIGPILAGRDLLGCAQTGTGKTAAFALPIIQRLSSTLLENGQIPRGAALILAPTRELAIQIGESFAAYGAHTELRHTVIFGGVGQAPQVASLKKHPHIIIATPGRLLDLMNQGYIKLQNLKILVLDEADRMLDMGFIHDIKKVIAALPRQRQTLLFSATIPPEINDLIDRLLVNPVKVAVQTISAPADGIEQRLYFVAKANKGSLLERLLSTDATMLKVLVFSRTKHGANRVAQMLNKNGHRAEAIHGNKSQTARQRALASFKDGSIKVLVASDIAARGLDVDEISHVVNFDLPEVAETYVHRIGRTARAKATGIGLAFCDKDELDSLHDIEKLMRMKIEEVKEHPYKDNGSRMPRDTSEPRPRPSSYGRPQARGGHSRPTQTRRSDAPRKPAYHGKPSPSSQGDTRRY